MQQQMSNSSNVPGDGPVLVTGGAGFIGSCFLLKLVAKHPYRQFINVDSLGFAGMKENVSAIEAARNYSFRQIDIRDSKAIQELFSEIKPDVVVNFAAETHVDRSIVDPGAFVSTNVNGTFNLLEAARRTWTDFNGRRFHHVSTDEVFGSLGEKGQFSETTSYDPSSPYSASKAASDHLVRAYHRTYGMPVTISNCSNNYGPRQFPEKLIPLFTTNAVEGKPLPIYGTGINIRDWLFVGDHCDAIWQIAQSPFVGETFNVGGNSERSNLQVVDAILDAVAEVTGRNRSELEKLKTFVSDRPGHDLRYAIDARKIREKLGWEPTVVFEDGIKETVAWYLQNLEWSARALDLRDRQTVELERLSI
jgi:dTDP-glucose 4,6-dehydratase